MPFKSLFLLCFCALSMSCVGEKVDAKPKLKAKNIYEHQWWGVLDPTEKPAQSYGGYSDGCVDGAAKLPEFGVGFKAMSELSNRMYGHPELIKTIEDIAKEMQEKYGKVILVGDLGHPRGGPASLETSAHRSHQTGLDVDIWYNALDLGEGTKIGIFPYSTLNKNKDGMSKEHWGKTQEAMLQLAAGFDEVERILVNPYVKKTMCDDYKGEKWLNKLRPWWSHDKHFHVRLKCPAGEKYCHKQAPVPKNDGCGAELAWWFSDEAKQMGKQRVEEKRVYPKMPKQCEAVWNWEE